MGRSSLFVVAGPPRPRGMERAALGGVVPVHLRAPLPGVHTGAEGAPGWEAARLQVRGLRGWRCVWGDCGGAGLGPACDQRCVGYLYPLWRHGSREPAVHKELVVIVLAFQPMSKRATRAGVVQIVVPCAVHSQAVRQLHRDHLATFRARVAERCKEWAAKIAELKQINDAAGGTLYHLHRSAGLPLPLVLDITDRLVQSQ